MPDTPDLKTVDLSRLTAADFSPHVRTRFALRGDDGEADTLTLTAVQARGGTGGGREPFALQFSAAPGRVLPQRIYALSHPALGAMEIFLTPLATGPDGTTYEAIFA